MKFALFRAGYEVCARSARESRPRSRKKQRGFRSAWGEKADYVSDRTSCEDVSFAIVIKQAPVNPALVRHSRSIIKIEYREHPKTTAQKLGFFILPGLAVLRRRQAFLT
jgi:hypothetical protein